MKNLAEWVKATVVVGPADEPMLRRAELLEEFVVECRGPRSEVYHTARAWEILDELAKEER